MGDEIMELRERLRRAEEMLHALEGNQVDAAIGRDRLTLLRLREAEDELKRSEARFRAIVEDQTDLICRWNSDRLVTFVNEAFCRFFERQRTELIGFPFEPNAHPEDRALLEQHRSGLRPDSPVAEVEHRSMVGEEPRWLRWTSRIILEPSGEIAEFQSVGRDITERKRAEQERERLLALVQERNAEMDAVFAAMQDAVVIYDKDMNVRRVNPIFIPTYGFDPVGLNIRDLIPRTKVRWLDGRPFRFEEQPTPRALCGETVLNQRYLITRLDGTEMALETSAAPLRVGDRVVGTVTVWHDITERRSAEAALRESEEQFRAMFELAAVGMAQADLRTGRLLRVNDKFCAITGYCADELLGKTFSEITHPDDRERDWETFQRAVRAETPDHRSEKRYLRKDGTVVWVNVNAAILHDAAGQPVRTVAAIEDITERKGAEEALRQSREDLDRAQEVGQIGWWRLDTQRNVLTWSDENHRIFGVPPATPLTYETFLGIVHADDRQYVDTQWKLGLHGEPYDIEHRILVGGQVKWVREKAYLEFDNEGVLLGGFGITQDITKRKQAEQALQHSLRRFELLAAIAGELLQTPEPQKVVEDLCRRVMEHLDCHACLNFLADEQAGRLRLNACAGIPPEEARRIEWLDYGVAVCGCVARDGCCIVAEHIPATPDVRTEPVKSLGIKAYACHPLLGVGGRVIGTLSFGTRSRETFSPDDLALMKAVADQVAAAMIRVRDEQALRASEGALRQANEELEEKIRERTAELLALNENLMETRDQLRSLASDLILTEAREKRALASELHDTVAQMLAIAKLTLESTAARLEGKSQEEVKRVVQILQEASRQTRTLMADLSPSLLYEAGLGLALRALARRMAELHALAIEVVDDGSPKPLGEDYRVILFRAVQELLHNTVKHPKATHVKVSLQREGNELRIEVEDDGVGFLVSPRGRGEGMREGFGLFSIRERLRHLGGSFEVFSQPGSGVRAVLLVPLQQESPGEGKEPAAVRILIAEDHRMMRDALASLLEKEPGFEVVGLAEDGLEAVRLAREVRPDVVLMDINMPKMDGIEATRQITADLPETRVIGLSVHADQQVVSEMLAAGATSFVPKSSSPEELIEGIRTAMRTGPPASGPQ